MVIFNSYVKLPEGNPSDDWAIVANFEPAVLFLLGSVRIHDSTPLTFHIEVARFFFSTAVLNVARWCNRMLQSITKHLTGRYMSWNYWDPPKEITNILFVLSLWSCFPPHFPFGDGDPVSPRAQAHAVCNLLLKFSLLAWGIARGQEERGRHPWSHLWPRDCRFCSFLLEPSNFRI